MKILKNILKYLILAGLFAIPFLIFIVPNNMFFPFITGKGFTFRILVEIIFGFFVVLAFWDAEYRPKLSWISKSILIFLAVIFVADIFGMNPYKSLWSNYERMEGFVLMIHLAMYYFVASGMLTTREKWNQLLNTSIFASVIMAIYGLMQAGGRIAIDQGSDRIDGTLGNATYLAIYAVFHIFICLYLMIDSQRPTWQKWAYGIAALLNAAVLYFTATRGATLGLIGGLVLTGLLIAWKEKTNLFFRKLAYGVIIASVVLVGIFWSVRNTSYVQNSHILSRFSTLSFSDLKTQGRYFVWPMAIKGFEERPILGWGQENFNFVFNKYYDPRMYGQEEWFDRTHDIFLDWLIAGGLLGFLAYFGMYGALLYLIWKKDSAMSLAEKSIFTGMISAYVFHNIFVFDNLISYIIFFSLLAYVHSISPKKLSTAKFYAKNFSESTISYTILPITLVATALIVYYVNIPALMANFTLIQAISPQGDVTKNLDLFKQVYAYNSFGSTEATEQIVSIASQVYDSTSLPDTIKNDFVNFAKQKVEEKVDQTPHDARYLVFAGSFLNHLSQYDQAIPYLVRAQAESPKKQSILFELGTSYIGKGDLTKAFDAFKQAYDLEPSAPESQIIYAVGAIYTRNATVFNQVASKIDPQTIINDNRFLTAYAYIGDYTDAINILNARLQKDPNNAQTKLSLASAYASIGQKAKAISLIQEIISANPSFKDQGEQYIKQIQG